MSLTITKPFTADELLALPDDGWRYELVKGELIRVSPTGHEHGRVTIRVTVPLAQHVLQNRLGEVFAAETGFKLTSNPDTVRAPDISFVSRERFERLSQSTGYWPGPPDLAVEVISPSETVGMVEDKVAQWLNAGTRAVWVVSPRLKTVTVYRALTDVVIFTADDVLNGGDVVPDFQIEVAEIFRK